MSRAKTCLLVTGSSGFLGSEVIRVAADVGSHVRGFDLRADTKIECEMATGDVLDLPERHEILTDVDSVIHCAGLAHAGYAVPESEMNAANVGGTEAVVNACVRGGVRHVVVVSSIAVYGAGEGVRDETAECRPEGAYAQSKYRAESRARELVSGSSTALTIIRLATIYGEGDRGNISKLIKAVHTGRFVWIGRGENRKSLIYRTDAARACVVASMKPGRGTDTYNVSGHPVQLRVIVGKIADLLGRKLPRWYVPERAAHLATAGGRLLSGNHKIFTELHCTVDRWLADDAYAASKYNDEFGPCSSVSLAVGLAREVGWYLSSQSG